MLPVQVGVGFPEGGQYVHLTEVNPLPFLSGPTGRDTIAQAEGSLRRPQAWETETPGVRAVGAGQPLSRPFRARA